MGRQPAHLRPETPAAPPVEDIFATDAVMAFNVGVKVGAVPAQPAYEYNKLMPAARDGKKVPALAREWPRGRRYEGELQEAIEGR